MIVAATQKHNRTGGSWPRVAAGFGLAAALISARACGQPPESQVGAGPGAMFFIATGGKDTNPGTKDQPFASLEKARDTIRKLKQDSAYPANGVTVTLRGGLYVRTKPFELGPDDSGLPGAPVAYQSWPGETARLAGDVDVTKPPYSTRYQEFLKVYTGGPDTKLYNEVFNNALVGCGTSVDPIRYPDAGYRHDNVDINADPGFIDEAAGDYTLRPDSKVFKEIPGLQPRPFEKMRRAAALAPGK
jgi:hypothetical protein